MLRPLMLAWLGTSFTFLMTALGAATVFFFARAVCERAQGALLGFAAGVMTAASVWSLILPAIEQTAAEGRLPPFLPAAAGIVLGALLLALLDEFTRQRGGERVTHSDFLLLSAITLHNIPEGLAVGVAFGSLQTAAQDPHALMGAVTIAVGIGLQNFPEGAAVSIPLRREGYSRKKSFLLGQASGIVEPIAGVIGASLVVHMQAILPYALSFAAGSMILVAVHELIPECQQNKETQPYFATMGIMIGFAVMMLLDVMLG